jgi:hypothetical protein
MNWTRIVLGGVVASLAMFVMEGVAGLLGTMKIYAAMMQRLHLVEPVNAGAFVFDGLISLMFGVLIAWVYAAMRPRFGAGPKTALLAAIAVWAPLHVGGTGYQVVLGMVTVREGVILSSVGLVICCIAALIAGAIYKEAPAARAVSA